MPPHSVSVLQFHLGRYCDLPELITASSSPGSGMAIYDPVRIKDTRRQFLSFWDIDLLLISCVSEDKASVGMLLSQGKRHGERNRTQDLCFNLSIKP